MHESISISYDQRELSVKICDLTTLDVEPPPLF